MFSFKKTDILNIADMSKSLIMNVRVIFFPGGWNLPQQQLEATLTPFKLESWRDSLPKNENSLIIYSPSSCSRPVWVSFFCYTQKKILWRIWVTKQLLVTTDSHSIKKITVEVKGDQQLFGLIYFLFSKYLLCSAKKVSPTGLEQLGE